MPGTIRRYGNEGHDYGRIRVNATGSAVEPYLNGVR